LNLLGGMAVYSFLLVVALIAGAPYWLIRMVTSGRYRAGLSARLGVIPNSLRERVKTIRLERRSGGGRRPLTWIHAVSVGEVLAAKRLIDEIRTGEFNKERPGMVFAVSTTTEAGQRLACERLSDSAVFYFPLDFKFIVRRYLRLLQPELVVLMESELWPRLIVECDAAKIPLVVANARISDRSFPRYMRLKSLWRPLLTKVAVFFAQSDESAVRLQQIGAPRIETTGNIKYDSSLAKETALVTNLRLRLQGDIDLIVCGSTLEGEEAIILDAWPSILSACPKALLVIAPRHPARFDHVALLLKKRGFETLRGTTFARTRVPVRPGLIFLLDTIGDLAGLYRLARIAFVGGSLVPSGGHNPLEPAQMGVPVLIGPSYENFREIVISMEANQGISIIDGKDFGLEVTKLLQDRKSARQMGARGRAVSDAQSGATARTARALLRLLPSRPDTRGESGQTRAAVPQLAIDPVEETEAQS
jgi:3-deoxy-D-manno-octulosonic-acid transferase